MMRIMLALLLSFALGVAARPHLADLKPRPERTVSPRIAEFEGMNERPVDIVMLGDSLTDRGRWSELLRISVANRGIGRDTVEMVTRRAHLIPPGPVYIMIGINDLIGGQAPKDIAQDYEALLSALEGRTISVQSVLGPEHLPVLELNTLLREAALEAGVDFLDLTPAFGHPIKEPLTIDGVHLTGVGYKTWAQEIRKHMDQ